MMNGIIFDIQRNSFVDGQGIRTTVFFKGCNLKCVWCHNPESQARAPQIMFYRDKCTACGRCAGLTVDDSDFICFNDAKEICGKKYTADEVMREILKDKAYYENSNGGVTFSGGECMLQIDFLCELLKKCKENGINTAVDTAGNVPRESIDKALPYTDTFLYDIKAMDEALHIKCTGQSNRQILDNIKYIDLHNKAIYVRIPYVPSFNDNQIGKIAEFLSTLKNVKQVELLPYHNYAGSKYAALGMENTLPEVLLCGEEIKKAQAEIRAKLKLPNGTAD